MEVINGNGFQQMMELQKLLVDKYIVIANMPQHPFSEVDLNLKSNQKFLRALSDKVIEEFAEGFNSIEQGLINASANNLSQAQHCIRNYNEEVADAMHFLLELLLYIGWDEATLDNGLKDYAAELNMTALYKSMNPIGTLLRFGHFLNVADDLLVVERGQFVIFSLSETSKDQLIVGGSRISVKGLRYHALLLWQITYSLKMAMNTLKNRDFTQTERAVNILKFEERMLSFLLATFQYLNFAGFTENSLFKSYCRKNEINQQRIKDGY